MARNGSASTNILIALIAIQLIPGAIRVIREGIERVAHNPKTNVGIVAIKGPIAESGATVRSLKEFFENPQIKSLVLVVDSPGGAPGASQAIWHVIRELKAKHDKKVVGFVQNVCASGGYYIMSAADHIVATPAAAVGSIGVFMPGWRVNELLKTYNVHYNVISAGKYKTVGNPFLGEPTPEQRKMLQDLVSDVYAQFVNDVKISRPHIVDDPELWAEGRIFTAQQAMKLGLVDELGSQLTVEHAVRRLANIPENTQIEWVRPARATGMSRLLQNLQGDQGDDEDGSFIHSFATAVADRLSQNLTAQGVTPHL